MKCLLIFPAWKTSDFFPEEFGSSTSHRWHPLGLLYIGAQLLKEGHEVKLLEGAFWTHEQILAAFSSFGPQFVGIYANCPLWSKAKKTAEDLRAIDKQVFISLGGPAAIGWRERCMEECAAVDCVHTGEAEYSVTKVLAQLEAGRPRDLHDVSGIIFRDQQGEIVINPNSPPITDLDALPFPARQLLGGFVDKYRPNMGTFRRLPVFSMISSRGCSHGDCIFCFQPGGPTGARLRSPKNVVDEMEECVKRYGAREIKFLDDTFTADSERVSAICAEIRRRKLDVTWFVSSRVDSVNREMLSEMKGAGCWAILYGVESGVQKNVDALRKGTTIEQARRAVRDAKAVGLKVSTPFIFGIPGETFEEGHETIDFAIELNADMVNFHTLTPYPATELYDHVARYGTMTNVSDELTFETAAFVPYTMSRNDILKLKQLAFKRFYSRPAYAVKRLLGIRSRYDLMAIVFGIKTLATIHLVPNVFARRIEDYPRNDL